jgi:predicted Mrr-cat superfamily restriction endonuclease
MKTWLLRPYPDSQDRLDDFKKEGIVAIGWSLTGDLSGLEQDDYRKILEDAYKLKGMSLTSTAITFDLFLNQMSIGDVLLIPYEDKALFARVESDYFFNAANKEGYAHQRKVSWKTGVERKELPMDLRSALKNKRVVASLEAYDSVICEFADVNFDTKSPSPDSEPPKLARRKMKTYEEETPFDNPADFVAAAYPLRPDFSIKLSLPKNLTKDESERLAAFVGSIYFSD